MIALRHAEATGQGQVLDLSLFEPIFAVMEPQIAKRQLTGRLKPRTGSRAPTPSRATPTSTRDGGWISLHLRQHPGHDGKATSAASTAPS